MMAVCPECGKHHVVTWPELNPFRRGERFYCSHGCWQISVDRDMKQIKEVQLNRRQRKMMELNKDGTVRKKPGPKPKKRIEIPEGEWTPAVDVYGPANGAEVPEQVPTLKVDGPLKIETPEAGKVEVVEKPEIPKKTIKVYKVTGIRTDYGEFYFDRKFNSIDWRTEGGDEVGMCPAAWAGLVEELPDIMKALGVEL